MLDGLAAKHQRWQARVPRRAAAGLADPSASNLSVEHELIPEPNPDRCCSRTQGSPPLLQGHTHSSSLCERRGQQRAVEFAFPTPCNARTCRSLRRPMSLTSGTIGSRAMLVRCDDGSCRAGAIIAAVSLRERQLTSLRAAGNAASDPDRSCPDARASACWLRRSPGTCYHHHRPSWQWPRACHP